MLSFSHFFYGLLAVALGVVFLRFNFAIAKFTGPQDWVERYLGYGSTYLFYELIAIAMVAGGILYATGLADAALNPILDPIAHMLNPGR